MVGATTATPQVLGLTVGQYLFELTVTDNDGAVSTADVTVTVIANTSSSALVADAGKDTTVAMPDTTAYLNGSGSTDAGGTINSYQWAQLSGPGLASMGAPGSALCTVGGLIEGQYIFQLTVKDNMGNSSTAYVKVQVINNLRTAAADELLIYPNPAHDQVNLRITSDSIGTVRVNIFDIEGRMVKVTEVSKQQSYLDELIDVSVLPAGSYILQVRIGQQKQMIAKLIKQ